jgi:hypothetical protein
MLKNIVYSFLLFAVFSLLTSCATICGGSKYWATVKVPDHPAAKISYNGIYQGEGNATFKVKRTMANKFSVSVKEEGCSEQTFNYTKRTFRGWAFFGTVVGWTGLIGGVPLPWGVAVDLATGALYKPNIFEKGIQKQDYKHYNYILEYKGCK